MKVLLYINQDKDNNGVIQKELCSALDKFNIKYEEYNKELSDQYDNFDAIFVVGGDGTILRRTSFVISKNIPIIGINAGKLGFLSEFDPKTINECVELFANNKLIIDERNLLQVSYNEKVYYALNDAVLQRSYTEGMGMTTDIEVSIDGHITDNINGDGIIIATPTGSTAYSLSAGGAILAPGINAFIITPISAHSFSERPLVYSADSVCELKYNDCVKPLLFIDGKFIALLQENEKISISSTNKKVKFLRRDSYNFYNRLTEKFKDRVGGK